MLVGGIVMGVGFAVGLAITVWQCSNPTKAFLRLYKTNAVRADTRTAIFMFTFGLCLVKGFRALRRSNG